MIQELTGKIEVSSVRMSEIRKKIKNVFDFRKEIEGSFLASATELTEAILIGAIYIDASDVHIEPQKKDVKIRARIDGMLWDFKNFDYKIYKTLLSRIKLLSGIKLNISDQPQDGRFSISVPESPEGAASQPCGANEIEIRVSVLPTEYGESLVLRILNPKSLIDLEALGPREDLLEIFKGEIKRPNGMIIVTGPTGAGKTTTLYAFLKEIQKPEIKIITIEDPIEYHLKGISQTQVAPEKGYDFASGLASIIRQDPNVILVGEIRDLETCNIALQAALTGHLVFATLHTNDAAGTIARLVNLGSDLFNIGPALNMVVAQRLVRKVCPKCVRLESVSSRVLDKIKKSLKGLPKEIEISNAGTIDKLGSDFKIPKAVGCQYCSQIGYLSRIGIFEVFVIDDEIENFILTNPSVVDFKNLLIKKGMVTLYQDGLLKVLNGITTIEEVERVVEE